jgi:hypothetical protein
VKACRLCRDCDRRHIFLEEAAEFAPQRIGHDQGSIYAEIEKLARMGGNAGLGYTLINQRLPGAPLGHVEHQSDPP